jgi:RimJ/RimL family protein N-acetyltransferase
MSEVTLRIFKESDRRCLDEMAMAIGSATYMSRYTPGQERCLLWRVIESGDIDVGTIWLEHEAGADSASLGILIGKSSHIGRRIGRKAIELAIVEACSRVPLRSISLRVRENNERAITCYKHCGFHIVGASRRTVDGIDCGVLHMEKLLQAERQVPGSPPGGLSRPAKLSA